MYYCSNYLSSWAVMMELAKAAEDDGARTSMMAKEEWLRFTFSEFWKFAETLPFAELMSPAGIIIRGENRLLLTDDPYSANGRYFSPMIGLLGSFNDDYFAYSWRQMVIDAVKHKFFWLGYKKIRNYFYSRPLMGPFKGMSVVFREEWVREYLNPVREEVPDLKSERQLGAAIVKAFDSGEIVTKADARERFGGVISARGFLRAWDRATEERPVLSRPGRRSKS